MTDNVLTFTGTVHSTRIFPGTGTSTTMVVLKVEKGGHVHYYQFKQYSPREVSYDDLVGDNVTINAYLNGSRWSGKQGEDRYENVLRIKSIERV